MPDIETPEDVRRIVYAFYHEIDSTLLIGAYFAKLDAEKHLAKMVAFWSSIVFQTGAYRGCPCDPHTQMPGLSRDHFAQWVSRFQQMVYTHFTGERADVMKSRAE